MALTLRFQSTGRIPGRADLIRMRGRSLTLGRAPENDVVLPDPDLMISKRHCVIEDHGGRMVVLDLSSNGTFLNYGKVPLGRTPTPLNDGDVLSVGPYELVVGLSDLDLPDPLDLPPLGDGPDLLPPIDDAPPRGTAQGRAALPGDPLGDPLGEDVDFLDALLGDAPPSGPARVRRPDPGDDGLLPPLGADDLPAAARPPDGAPWGASLPDHSDAMRDSFAPPRARAAIPDDWDLDDLMPGAPPRVARPSAPPPLAPVQAQSSPPAPMPGADPFAEPPPPLPPRPAETAPAAAPPPVPAAPDAAARAFLRALGAGDVPVPDQDLTATMERLGAAMGVMVQGLREVLMTRSAIKSEFRIQQTQIAAGGNNPLKFSVSPDQAIEALVRPRGRGYLDAAEAARQALDDIRAHEMAMMSGLEAALKDILRKLAPETLEGKIDVSGGLGSLLKGRKARYWEIYEKMYAEIAAQAEDDFHDLFAREFARAYQRQMDLLKQAAAPQKGGPGDVLG
jgi:type VI secretion system FHA domain protein